MIDRDQAIAILKKNNPAASMDRIIMYCDSYMDYQEAAENIIENGAICSHPKTGGPIENPYLKVRQQMQAKLSKNRLKIQGLWG